MLNKRIILLFGIALAGIALRIKFFTGFVGSDDISYVQTGLLMQFLSDKVAGIQNIIASLRIGMVLPLAVIFRLVGYGPVTAILYPFVCSIATIFVVYLLASYVFEDSKMGLCAAYLWGLMPLDV
ncbi:MAG: hypothetical protein KBA46_04890, partial [Candidatus Omnitrophica bacterium]|nr:hypothetical protein [Candidatus Omnitrophota bacterium]